MLIADDQQLLRAGFRAILDGEPDIDVVGEADDGVAAVRFSRGAGAPRFVSFVPSWSSSAPSGSPRSPGPPPELRDFTERELDVLIGFATPPPRGADSI